MLNAVPYSLAINFAVVVGKDVAYRFDTSQINHRVGRAGSFGHRAGFLSGAKHAHKQAVGQDSGIEGVGSDEGFLIHPDIRHTALVSWITPYSSATRV